MAYYIRFLEKRLQDSWILSHQSTYAYATWVHHTTIMFRGRLDLKQNGKVTRRSYLEKDAKEVNSVQLKSKQRRELLSSRVKITLGACSNGEWPL